MAVNDLSPRLRTRLNRLEQIVGWFVTLAALLMLSGLGYYVYHTAEAKGWFRKKAPYFVYLHSANGLKEGDAVKLMGWDVGQITKVSFEDPGKEYDVYVEFVVREPFYGYVWSDSRVKSKGGILGGRYLEITKGGTSGLKPVFATYKDNPRRITEVLVRNGSFTNFVQGHTKYWLQVDEPPDITAQLDQVAVVVRDAIPNILSITNRVNDVLSNSVSATMNLVALLDGARPIITNFLAITAHLRDPKGSLGDWLVPSNVSVQLTQTLSSANLVLQSANTAMGSANTLVTNSDTRVEVLISNLNLSLVSMAGITSNLHQQVDQNTNLVTGLNRMIVDTDNMIQGLKRHWLLRSAFKTNAAGASSAPVTNKLNTPRNPWGR